MTSPLWTAKDIADATESEWQGALDEAFQRIIIDSRQATKGDVFIALIGDNHDAHHFVQNALEQGASAALVSYIPEGLDANDKRLFLIDYDPLEGLVRLGKHARERLLGNVIGVTGSVGKTSTKEALNTAFGACGNAYATSGNYNNHIGVPLTLANMPAETDYAIIEMGMSAEGEISYLTQMARPHIAIITAIEAAHIEFFDSVEGIADAKLEIAEGLEEGGTLILPHDNPYYNYLRVHSAHIANRLAFGMHQDAEFRVSDYRLTKEGMAIDAVIHDSVISYQISALGAHWAALTTLSLGVAELLDADLSKAAEGLAQFAEPKGRGQLLPVPVQDGDMLVIDDSYNASPASMRAAFVKLQAMRAAGVVESRLIVVLGDMLELGEDSVEIHKNLCDDILDAGIDRVFTAGEMMQHLYQLLPAHMCGGWAREALLLAPLLRDALRMGDAVLFKGSHGSNIHALVTEITKS